MVGKTQPATKAEAERMHQVKYYTGCIPCLLSPRPILNVHATVQHVKEGNKRLGHQYTYAVCGYHHFGHNPKMFGPSLALNSREYAEVFGTERQLVSVQDFALSLLSQMGWWEFEMPINAGEQIREYWVKLRQNSTED